jgi:hypothetical protein
MNTVMQGHNRNLFAVFGKDMAYISASEQPDGDHW